MSSTLGEFPVLFSRRNAIRAAARVLSIFSGSALAATSEKASTGALPGAVSLLDATSTVTPQMFGAVGDGVADDTRSVQSALDHVVAKGGRLLFPGGRYRVTSPVCVGNDGDEYRGGFAIEGVARSSPKSNGTLISLDAVEATAVLIWKKTAWRNATLKNLGLVCSKLDAAKFGLLIDSSEISDIHFDNLDIENVTTAIGLHQGTGRNGEFCSFSNIWTWNVLNFFHSNAGQAFGINISHVFCYHRGGGELFKMDPLIVGGGVIVRAFNATPTDPEKRKGVSNTTLIALSEKHNAPVLFEGGRLEHLTCILSIRQFSEDGIVNTPIKFIGTQFTMDSIEGHPENKTPGQVVLEGTSPNLISFDTCQFSTFNSTKTVFVARADQRARGTLVFAMCNFNGFSRLPTVELGFNTAQVVRFEDCIGNPVTSGGMKALGVPTKFGRVFGGSKRLDIVLSHDARGTRSSNLLVLPKFCNEPNLSAAPSVCDPPWKHYGAVAQPSVRGGGETVRSKLQSTDVKLFLPARSGIFQDISRLSLAEGNEAIGGVKLTYVEYDAHLVKVSGRAGLRFALENSATQQIYDEVRFAGEGRSEVGQHVRLISHVEVTQLGLLRFKLENLGPEPAELDFGYQRLSSGQGIGKSFRSEDASISPLGPQMWRLSQPPTEGAWSDGDIVYNSVPRPGGYLGWVCVHGGEPGEWKSFGAIAL